MTTTLSVYIPECVAFLKFTNFLWLLPSRYNLCDFRMPFGALTASIMHMGPQSLTSFSEKTRSTCGVRTSRYKTLYVALSILMFCLFAKRKFLFTSCSSAFDPDPFSTMGIGSKILIAPKQRGPTHINHLMNGGSLTSG